MNPKEKAKDIINKFDLPSGLMSKERIQCALICVSEIIKFGNMLELREPIMYWQKVKQEIKKYENN